MKKLIAGIVGCETIFKPHYAFINSCKRCEIVGVAETNTEIQKKIKNEYNVRVFKSLENLIDKEKTDVIHHITTPSQTHYSLAETAIKKLNNVFIEKPIALYYDDAKRLYKIADKKNVKICVDHNHLFDPWMIEGNKTIGTIGKEKINYVESFYGFNFNIPEVMRDKEPNELSWVFDMPGGLFHNFLTHPVYLMLQYTGMPKNIYTITRNFGELMHNLPDELHVMVDRENCWEHRFNFLPKSPVMFLTKASGYTLPFYS